MQAPGLLDLNLYQGASWDYTLTWQTGGTAVNLSGYDARMTYGSSLGETDDNVQITNPQDGDVLRYNGTTGVWENGQP